MLIPSLLDELIKADHPVRTINSIIYRLDLDPLLKQYDGGVISSYRSCYSTC